MGEAATETETPIRPGRYLLPLARRLIFPVIIVAELAMGYVNELGIRSRCVRLGMRFYCSGGPGYWAGVLVRAVDRR